MSKVQSALASPEVAGSQGRGAGADVGKQSKFREMVTHRKKGWRRILWLIWALMGPGLIAAIANNDAGGAIAYAVTGATFGIGLFVPLVLCLAPLTFTIQEMSMRLSAVTQEGFARLALRRYGKFWGYYHISTLAFENLLILITEFIGMTAGLVLLGFLYGLALSYVYCSSLVSFSLPDIGQRSGLLYFWVCST